MQLFSRFNLVNSLCSLFFFFLRLSKLETNYINENRNTQRGLTITQAPGNVLHSIPWLTYVSFRVTVGLHHPIIRTVISSAVPHFLNQTDGLMQMLNRFLSGETILTV